MVKNLDSASSNNKNSDFQPPKIQNAPHGSDTKVSILKNPGRLLSAQQFTEPGGGSAKSKKNKSILKWIFFILLAAILFLGALAINRTAILSEKIFAGKKTTFFGKVWETLRGATGKVTLLGENQGKINILLLGIGGPGHEGPYLTDTIILAQILPKTSEVSFVSIPRDMLAELPNNLGERKINTVFAEGIARTKDFNTAGRWAAMATERLSGQTIPYFAVIDFAGFKMAVDEIGGLDITVENSFADAQFPNEKLGYLPPVVFEKGKEHMDGTRALQFARSRHGNNNEGSDFTRGLRQQKVIKAFKDKLLEINLLTNLGRINTLLGIFANNFHTNLSPGEIFRLYNLAKEQNIQTFLSLNLGLETGLVCPTTHETAGYILIPCAGKTYNDIQSFFKNSFVLGKLSQEKATIWLGDSTQNPSRLKQAESLLKEAGLTVWRLDYSKDDFPQTIAFQANPKPATLEFIKNILNAKVLTLPPPGVNADPSKVDIVVILGKKN